MIDDFIPGTVAIPEKKFSVIIARDNVRSFLEAMFDAGYAYTMHKAKDWDSIDPFYTRLNKSRDKTKFYVDTARLEIQSGPATSEFQGATREYSFEELFRPKESFSDIDPFFYLQETSL